MSYLEGFKTENTTNPDWEAQLWKTSPDWEAEAAKAADAAEAAAALQQSGAGTAAIDGRADRPTPLSRWYGTVESIASGIAVVVLDDDSNGASTISVPTENSSPVAGNRVVVDFRVDGLAVVTAVL